MKQMVLIFGEDCINKNGFHKDKRPINIDEVDIRRIVLSRINSYGNKGSFKYYIGYIHKGEVFPKPLCIKLPKINVFVKYFDSNNKYMNLLAKDKELLKKSNEVWKKA